MVLEGFMVSDVNKNRVETPFFNLTFSLQFKYVHHLTIIPHTILHLLSARAFDTIQHKISHLLTFENLLEDGTFCIFSFEPGETFDVEL